MIILSFVWQREKLSNKKKEIYEKWIKNGCLIGKRRTIILFLNIIILTIHYHHNKRVKFKNKTQLKLWVS